MSDGLVLTVDGKKLEGWTRVSVTAGIEQMPNAFQIDATENDASKTAAAGIKEGSACTVALGSDKVITGYVDQVIPYLTAGEHGVRLVGRGKCQDLVDCSAEWPRSQISGANAVEIATKLAKPYGITVKAKSGAGPAVPQFNINVDTSPAQVIEMVTRHAGLLFYEGPDGELILSEAASDDAASGFEEGKNVQDAAVIKSMSQRFSKIKASRLGVDTSGLLEYSDGLFYFEAADPFVSRHRQLVIVAEGVQGGLELCKKRALWEAARRAGRGRTVNVTVDSWRDKAGKLWTPNTLAQVELPSLKLTGAKYLIAAVTFEDGLGSGQVARVTLMPREGFEPEPIQLQPQVGGVK